MFNDTNVIVDISSNERPDERPIPEEPSVVFNLKQPKPVKGSLIIVDNFYNNADDVRGYVLNQEFSVKGNYPGQRTISYATEYLKDVIQKYVEPFAKYIGTYDLHVGYNA
jgi:hypothetical protein